MTHWIKNNRRTETFFAVSGVIAAIVGLLVSFYGLFSVPTPKPSPTIGIPPEIEIIPSQVFGLSQQIDSIQNQINGLSQIPVDNAINIRLANIQFDINTLKDQLKSLNNAILDNPSKAIELPLMRKDIDQISKDQTEAIAQLQGNLNQLVDLGKWLIGGIYFSVIGLIISALFSRIGSKNKVSKAEDS